MSRLWMVAYDIEDDKCRRRVHNLLKNHGERVQFSVFECWLNEGELQLLRQCIQNEIEEDDGVRWYPLCVWCQGELNWQGNGNAAENPEYFLL